MDTVLLEAALARFDAALRAGTSATWDDTGLPAEQKQDVEDEVVADVLGRAAELIRSVMAHNVAIFDETRPGVLAGPGVLITDVVLELFRMRLPLAIAIRRMVGAELALADARGPSREPEPPPPPGLRDIVPPR